MPKHPSPLVAALLRTGQVPRSVIVRMVQEGRLDMEEVNRLCGSEDENLSTEEIADLLEEALRQNLQVTTFDPL